ncbi:hypothetical protein FRC09_009405 [Ceratobasidium sp. 395]|nr:hypothetical protein FRC09_009405 [Ceratobasidium sp. 395]
MIALTPEFAALLASIAASAVGAAPNPRSGDQDRRYVVDVDLPSVAKVHMRPRNFASNSRILGRHHEHEQGEDIEPADTKAVYIQPPASAAASGKDASRRSLEDPIDQPDPNEELYAEDADVALVDHVTGVFTSKDGSDNLRRTMLRVDSQYGPGLIITRAASHEVQQISRALTLHGLSRRGLLDPLMPILGSIPGIGGIIQLIGGTLSDVLGGLPILGPVLGDLILSPHPSASAQGVESGSESGSSQFFLDASSSRNASTIYVVDSGHPTSFAIASQFNNTNATAEHVVSLQMAFVNATSGQVQAYCATFDNDSTGGQSALAVKPCITDGVTSVPHASQRFGWNRANKAVRPLWNDEAGNEKRKRAYVVQAGSSGAAVMTENEKDKPESVVLVFKPFEAQAPSNGTNTDDSSNGKDATGVGADEDPTVPAPNPAVAALEDEDDSVPVFVAGVDSS